MIPEHSVNDHLGRIADSFVLRYRRGEPRPVSEYAKEHPDLADEIRELLPALVLLEEAKQGSHPCTEPMHAIGREVDVNMPDRLGDYRIVRVIGRGGMGVVYEAEQQSLGRRVALKVLPTSAQLNPRHLQRFHREAKSAARLHHTNIVPVYGVGEDQGVHYIVMQYVAGQGLDQVIGELRRSVPKEQTDQTHVAKDKETARQNDAVTELARCLLSARIDSTTGSWNESLVAAVPDGETARCETSQTTRSVLPKRYWRNVAQIGVQVAEALEYAHGQGTVHRDVKPSNLLLDPGGKIWVTDFGLAKAADQQNLTATGDLVGTLRYMAPESFGGQYDARSDVYSLGLTLYELAALKRAHNAPVRNELIQQVRQGAVPPLRKVHPKVPRDLETIVHKSLDPDPWRRYQTAGDLAADLRRFDNDEPIRARRVSRIERVGRWCRRNPAISLVTGCAGLAIVLTVCIAFALITASRNRAVRLASDMANLAKTKEHLLDEKTRLLDEKAHLVHRERQARTTAETALKHAEEQRKQAETSKEDAEKAADEAKTVNDFLIEGMIRAAFPEYSRGEDLTVREMLDRAARLVGERFAEHPEREAVVRSAVARAYHSLGLYEQSHPHWARALELRQRILGPEHLTTIITMNNLASNHYSRGMYDQGRQLEEESLAILRRVHGAEHPTTLTTMSNLAANLHGQGKYQEAQKLFQECLKLKRRLLEPDDFGTTATMGNLAVNLQEQGRYEEAQKLNEEALEIQRRVLGPEHPSTLITMGNLAETLNRQRKYQEAQKLHEHVLKTRRRVLGPDHHDTLAAVHNLAANLDDLGQVDKAQEIYSQLVEDTRRVLGAQHPSTIMALSNLATAFTGQGRYDKAQANYEQALAASRKTLGTDHPASIRILKNLARSLYLQEKYQEAGTIYQEAFEINRRLHGERHIETLGAKLSLADSLVADKKHEQAQTLLRDSLDHQQKFLGEGHWLTGCTKSLLGGSLIRMGQYEKAEPLVLSGYETTKSDHDASAESIIEALEWIVDLYEGWGKTEKAAQWRKELAALAGRDGQPSPKSTGRKIAAPETDGDPHEQTIP